MPAAVTTKYKTKLCLNWVRHGECPYGDRCQFAHGYGELRLELNYFSEKDSSFRFTGRRLFLRPGATSVSQVVTPDAPKSTAPSASRLRPEAMPYTPAPGFPSTPPGTPLTPPLYGISDDLDLLMPPLPDGLCTSDRSSGISTATSPVPSIGSLSDEGGSGSTRMGNLTPELAPIGPTSLVLAPLLKLATTKPTNATSNSSPTATATATATAWNPWGSSATTDWALLARQLAEHTESSEASPSGLILGI